MAKIYLDRSEVLKKIGYVARSWGIFEGVREKLADTIKAIPAADVAPVVHGKWAHVGGDEWCCSRCGYVVTTESRDEEPRKKYCSDCGARMDGEEGEAGA